MTDGEKCPTTNCLTDTAKDAATASHHSLAFMFRSPP
jgi:hypothetical protein